MNKTHVKRSTFQLVKLTDAIITATVLVEGDEAYATVFNASSTVLVKRQREADLDTFQAANPATYSNNTQTWGVLDPAFGRVPLDVPIAVFGGFFNQSVTTVANDVAQSPERIRSNSVGFKEKVVFRLSDITAGKTANILIETVNYIPVDLINA